MRTPVIVACWSGKVLKTTNGGLTFTGQVGSEIPKDFSLGQNYPNPFNPSTTIKFSLPKSEYVSVKVYDMKGSLVKVLVNEKFAAGSFEVSFGAEGLSSGVYYYRMEAGSYSETKRMMYLK